MDLSLIFTSLNICRGCFNVKLGRLILVLFRLYVLASQISIYLAWVIQTHLVNVSCVNDCLAKGSRHKMGFVVVFVL